MLIGYARVSTEEQQTHSQTDALKAAGCEVIYEEKRSGGSLSRPILFELLKAIQPGDVVVVYKLDRIARSLKDLLTIQERIADAGADFKSLTEILDTTSPAGVSDRRNQATSESAYSGHPGVASGAAESAYTGHGVIGIYRPVQSRHKPATA